MAVQTNHAHTSFVINVYTNATIAPILRKSTSARVNESQEQNINVYD